MLGKWLLHTRSKVDKTRVVHARAMGVVATLQFRSWATVTILLASLSQESIGLLRDGGLAFSPARESRLPPLLRGPDGVDVDSGLAGSSSS
jgi:hypothetical protein